MYVVYNLMVSPPLRATLTSDLETAETRLENALASLDKEKNTRYINSNMTMFVLIYYQYILAPL